MEKNLNMNEKGYPLILVFYLDSELMKQPRIIGPFSEMVNKMLIDKEANALAFFLPTNGEERVECINPIVMKETDMEKINLMIEDIKKNFSVGVEDSLPDTEIIINTKPCNCGNNPDGSCQCD